MAVGGDAIRDSGLFTQTLAEADPAGLGQRVRRLARRHARESVASRLLPPGSLARGRWAAVVHAKGDHHNDRE